MNYFNLKAVLMYHLCIDKVSIPEVLAEISEKPLDVCCKSSAPG